MNVFGILNANFEEKYRERSNAAPLSLVRKKCGCGAVVGLIATAFVVSTNQRDPE